MLPASALVEPLRYLQLLPADQLQEVERFIAASPTAAARAVTDYLVQRGWLTAYQGKELSTGRGYELVIGPYLVLSLLGKGGMGEVFCARHRRMERMDALKRLKTEYIDNQEVIERFRREIKAAAKLSHPNIVRVYHADEIGGVDYLAMELLQGVNLKEYIENHHPLPVEEAIEYVRQACEGMQHAHEKGLVHRDLKPANLMRTEKGQIKILDMGLALMAEANTLTQTGAILYTPDYAAPEQVTDASRVDIRADVYSLGCTLYHLLAGQTPYAHIDIRFRAMMHVNPEEPPLIEGIRADVPGPVADVVRQMMAKKREQRHQTPGEAAIALETLHVRGVGRTASLRATLVASSQQTIVLPGRNEVEVIPQVWLNPSGVEIPRTFTNSIGMKFVLVEPGTFLMGSPEDAPNRDDDEKQHEVTITLPFYLAIHPTTQGQWMKVMGHNPSYFSRTGSGANNLRDISDADLAMFPVEQVSWKDTQNFLNALSALEAEKKLNRQYRLPSEAEWEYTCRGGHLQQVFPQEAQLPFHFEQPTSSLSSTQANFNGNSPSVGAAKGPYLQRTSKVGSYKPNALGIFDMHGNIWEWCADWYAAYPTKSATDPFGPSGGSGRVYRGGCWGSDGQDCRAAFRSRFGPQYRHYSIGFRVALVPSSGT